MVAWSLGTASVPGGGIIRFLLFMNVSVRYERGILLTHNLWKFDYE
jgi:hypothetical protein